MLLCLCVPVIPFLPLTATLFWALSPSAAERPEWVLPPQLSCLEDSLQAWSKGVPWASPQSPESHPGIVSPSLSPLPQKEVQALQPGIPHRPQNSPIPSSCALGCKAKHWAFPQAHLGPIPLSPATPAAARQARPALPAAGIQASPQGQLKCSSLAPCLCQNIQNEPGPESCTTSSALFSRALTYPT